MSIPSELDILTKSFNRLENYVTKYIYKKYIEQLTILEEPNQILDLNNDDNNDDNNDNDNDTDNKKYKYSLKVTNTDDYSKYLHTIFSQERKSMITQTESLNEELENMRIADEAYEKDPEGFHYKDYNSIPDMKRCSFIRKVKNKYKRCGNKIINDDSDMCYMHVDSLNIYWDNWCKIIENVKH